MAKTVRKGLMGLEDLSVGSGTFTRGTSTGGTQTLTKFSWTAVGIAVTSVTTTPYTAAATDGVILSNVSSASTINLPTAVGNSGKVLFIKNLHATNTVTIDASSTQTIDGALTYTLTLQYEVVSIVSDGSNWHIIA